MVSFGLEDFAKRYGTLTPSQFVDVVALVGDKSDNIPGRVGLSFFFFLFVVHLLMRFLKFCAIFITGVTGIGEVNAVQLITEYGSLEELLSNVDRVKQGHIKEVLVLSSFDCNTKGKKYLC